MQVPLLVNNDTPGMDVEEVSLSFLRSGNESNMPALRSFIQITDWPLVERVFEVAGVEGPGRGHRFAKDLKFRIPGGPIRSYLTARETVIFLAEDEAEDEDEEVPLVYVPRMCRVPCCGWVEPNPLVGYLSRDRPVPSWWVDHAIGKATGAYGASATKDLGHVAG